MLGLDFRVWIHHRPGLVLWGVRALVVKEDSSCARGTGACVRGPAGQARGFTLKSGLEEARNLEEARSLATKGQPWSLWAPHLVQAPRATRQG